MVGIVSYGAYIPKYRLSRDFIARAWDKSSMGGEKAVANWDEDTITMAVEAASDCLGVMDPQQVDGLYFASTTAPYKEKLSASLIATALDFRRDILTLDFSDSLRAGTSALKAGMDAIESKSAKQVLVTVADCRLGAAESDLEQIVGDGAAALLIGNSDIVANITGSYSVSDEFIDYWRTDNEVFTNSWEDRFANIAGYENSVKGAVDGILKKYELTPGNFSKLVLYAHHPRQHMAMARSLGFDVKSQLSDSLFNTVGNTGAALAPMMLVATLEQAKPGDRILLVGYGDGSHAFVLEVTENIKKVKDSRGIKGYLASKAPLDSYNKYVRFRNLMPKEPRHDTINPTSLPLLWREKKSFISFYGSKCKRCSLIQHPVQRVCFGCKSKDEYEEVRLARRGKIFTYAEDYLSETPTPPEIRAVVMLGDGARVCLTLTEAEAQASSDRPEKLGMPVEMTLRKVDDASGVHNYYWKAKPIRGGN